MSGLAEVIIIGAGPYGLSLAAHLRAANIQYRIFGQPMASWKRNMPPGMLLKSRLRSSNLYDPAGKFTLKAFCQQAAIPHGELIPPTLETFIAYGEAFQAHLVPDVEDKYLTKLERIAERYRATFDDGVVVDAQNVVLAIGVHPFRHVPDTLCKLPPELVSHSSDYGRLDGLKGKTVLIVGGGSSATDLAALLNENGARVTLITRAPALSFVGPSAQRSAIRRYLKHVLTPLYPSSGIGSGWLLKICADAPWLFHALPDQWRLHIAATALGPKGHDYMKDRVIGKVDVKTGRTLVAANPAGAFVECQLAAGDGSQETFLADHVIAATGYKVDLDKLSFLDERIRSGIQTLQGGPILSSSYESSVPGLYFVGPASLNSFGPVARFVFGAAHPSRKITHRLARRFAKHPSAGSAPVPLPIGSDGQTAGLRNK